MGCERPSTTQPIGPTPSPCGFNMVFLRDLWWQDATGDGTLIDDGSDTQTGFPFADQNAQRITPRVMRNFAYEISKALCTMPGYLLDEGGLLDTLVFFLGDGTYGEDGWLYYTTEVPTPIPSDDMAGWVPLGQITGEDGEDGTGIAGITYDPNTHELIITMTDDTVHRFDISGARGSLWMTGTGPPDPDMTAPDGSFLRPGDHYLESVTGDVYEFV